MARLMRGKCNQSHAVTLTMKHLYKIPIFALSIILVTGLFLFVHLGLILPLVESHIKSEEVSDSNWLFFIFFDISSDTGYEIDVSYFNLFLTYSLGIWGGIRLGRRIINKYGLERK